MKVLRNNLIDDISELYSQHWWHCVAHLMILLCLRTLEKVIVWEGLESRCFSYGKRADLFGIGVNIVMTVFRYVGHYG